jgi:hypothetical protein
MRSSHIVSTSDQQQVKGLKLGRKRPIVSFQKVMERERERESEREGGGGEVVGSEPRPALPG